MKVRQQPKKLQADKFKYLMLPICKFEQTYYLQQNYNVFYLITFTNFYSEFTILLMTFLEEVNVKISLSDVESDNNKISIFELKSWSSCRNFILLSRGSTLFVFRINSSNETYHLFHKLNFESDIKSLHVENIPERFIQSKQLPKWSAFIVGTSDGYIHILNELGFELIILRFSNGPVIKICKNNISSNQYESLDNFNKEYVYFLYPTLVIEIALDQLVGQLEIAMLILAGEPVQTCDRLHFRRIKIKENDDLCNIIPMGYRRQSVFDHLVARTISTGRVAFPEMPTLEIQFFTFGSSPSIGFNSVFIDNKFSLSKFASNLKNSTIGAFFNYTRRENYNGDIVWNTTGKDYMAPICEWSREVLDNVSDLHTSEMIYAIADMKRRITSHNPIAISPNNRWLCVHDNLARILIIDTHEGTCVHMLKGYRRIEMSFFEITLSSLGQINFIVVLDKFRSHLQVINIPGGNLISSFLLPSQDYHLLWITVDDGLEEIHRYITLVDDQGRLIRIKFSLDDYLKKVAMSNQNEERDQAVELDHHKILKEFGELKTNKETFINQIGDNFLKVNRYSTFQSLLLSLLTNEFLRQNDEFEVYEHMLTEICNKVLTANKDSTERREDLNEVQALLQSAISTCNALSLLIAMDNFQIEPNNSSFYKKTLDLIKDENANFSYMTDFYLNSFPTETSNSERGDKAHPISLFYNLFACDVIGLVDGTKFELVTNYRQCNLVEIGGILYRPLLSIKDVEKLETFEDTISVLNLSQDSEWRAFLAWWTSEENLPNVLSNHSVLEEFILRRIFQTLREHRDSSRSDNDLSESDVVINIFDKIDRICCESEQLFSAFVLESILLQILLKNKHKFQSLLGDRIFPSIQRVLKRNLKILEKLLALTSFMKAERSDEGRDLKPASYYFKSSVNLRLVLENGRRLFQDSLSCWIYSNDVSSELIAVLNYSICNDAMATGHFTAGQIDNFKYLYNALPLTLYLDHVYTGSAWEACLDLNTDYEANNMSKVATKLEKCVNYIMAIGSSNSQIKIGLATILWNDFLFSIFQTELNDILSNRQNDILPTKMSIFSSFENLFFDLVKNREHFEFDPVVSKEDIWKPEKDPDDLPRAKLFSRIEDKTTLSEICVSQYSSCMKNVVIESLFQISCVIGHLLTPHKELSREYILRMLIGVFNPLNIDQMRSTFSPFWSLMKFDENLFTQQKRQALIENLIVNRLQTYAAKTDKSLQLEVDKILHISREWNIETEFVQKRLAEKFYLLGKKEMAVSYYSASLKN